MNIKMAKSIMPCGKEACDTSCTIEKCKQNPNCRYKNSSKAFKIEEIKTSLKNCTDCISCGKCKND